MNWRTAMAFMAVLAAVVAVVAPLVRAFLPARSRPRARVRLDRNVQLSAFRPRAMAPNQWYPLLVFVYRPEDAQEGAPPPSDPLREIQAQARLLLGEQREAYEERGQDLPVPIPRTGDLILVPRAEGVEFNPARQTFRWEEAIHRADFRMAAPDAQNGDVLHGELSVYLGLVLIATVPLAFRIETRAAYRRLRLERADARLYRRIFASYAHEDAAIVDTFERIVRTMGDDYLRDMVVLRSGEQWHPALQTLIEQADVFQLFWSTNSRASDNVRQEWEHALSLRRPNFIRPTYWEDPLPPPPPELAAVQFHRLGPPASPPAGRPGVLLQAPLGQNTAFGLVMLVLASYLWDRHVPTDPTHRPNPSVLDPPGLDGGSAYQPGPRDAGPWIAPPDEEDGSARFAPLPDTDAGPESDPQEESDAGSMRPALDAGVVIDPDHESSSDAGGSGEPPQAHRCQADWAWEARATTASPASDVGLTVKACYDPVLEPKDAFSVDIAVQVTWSDRLVISALVHPSGILDSRHLNDCVQEKLPRNRVYAGARYYLRISCAKLIER